jgi:hypothetical protein
MSTPDPATTYWIPLAGGGGGDVSSAVIKAPDTSVRNLIQPTAPAVKPFCIKAAALQTANLFEWQNSAGTTLGFIRSDGYLQAPTMRVTGDTNLDANVLMSGGYIHNTGMVAGSIAFVTEAAGDTQYRLVINNTGALFWTDGASSTLALLRLTAPGSLEYTETYVAYKAASPSSWATAVSASTNPGGPYAALVLRGSGKMEWSNGDQNFDVSLERPQAGWLQLNGSLSVVGNFFNAGTQIVSPGATSVSLTVTGGPSQTADLQQWQTSDNSSVLRIEKDGKISTGVANTPKVWLNQNYGLPLLDVSFPYGGVFRTTEANVFGNSDVFFQGVTGSSLGWTALEGFQGAGLILATGPIDNPVSIRPNRVESALFEGSGVGKVKLILKGAAGQTADLQQWQNSSAASLAKIDKNGTFFTKANAAPADASINTNDMALWFDPTNGAAKLMVKAKQADGTVQIGSIPLGVVDPTGFTIVRKPTDESVANSITIQNDDHLFFTAVLNVTYEIEMVVIYSSPVGAGVPDLKMDFGEDATVRGGMVITGYTSTEIYQTTVVTTNQSATAVGTAATLRSLVIKGTHVGNGGVFRFRWAQSTSNANNVTVFAGSVLRYRAIT